MQDKKPLNEVHEPEFVALNELGKKISNRFSKDFLGIWEIPPFDPDKPHKIQIRACIQGVRIRHNRISKTFTFTRMQDRKTCFGLSEDDVLILIEAYIIENERNISKAKLIAA